jgi:hypothetical protein
LSSCLARQPIRHDSSRHHPQPLQEFAKEDTPDVQIPGLKVSFEGAAGSQENQVDAKAITFDSDDLALAEVIQTGSEKEIIR